MAGPQGHGHLVELGRRRCQHRHLAKLHGHLHERHERGQPHGRLAKVHGDLAELGGRGQLHHCLAELGGRGCPHHHLVKLHGRLTELGGRRRLHRSLAEPNGRGQPHNCLIEPGLEEWQKWSSMEEGDRTSIWKNGKRGVGLQPELAQSPKAKTFTGKTKFSLKDGSNI
ncbi:unnamed protein product [Sphagnum jensenii]|uniref:Uncharacterized protein n=1 Tax=Sphagnum jensenii TaxID=128206 RepID=A0ABP1BZ67_9BRYO